MDILFDSFGASRCFRLIAAPDECRHANLGLVADAGLPGERITRGLNSLVRVYGEPLRIISENDTEITSRTVLAWAQNAAWLGTYIATSTKCENSEA